MQADVNPRLLGDFGERPDGRSKPSYLAPSSNEYGMYDVVEPMLGFSEHDTGWPGVLRSQRVKCREVLEDFGMWRM